MPIEELLYAEDQPETHLLTSDPTLRVSPVRFLVLSTPPTTPPTLVAVDAATYLAANSDVHLRITAQLKNTAGLAHPLVGNEEVTVNLATGEVSFIVGLTSPVSRKNNFIVDVEAEQTSAAGPSTYFRRRVRVHVHDSIDALWLTPNPITVHWFAQTVPGGPVGGNNVGRLRLRAAFDDGTVGDITAMPGVKWFPTDLAGPGGILNITDATPLSSLVTAQYGQHLADGEVFRGIDYDGNTSLVAELVPGSGFPEPGHPSVLFLAEGFGPSGPQATMFDAHVRNTLHWLRTDPLNIPFTFVTDAMTFWKTDQLSAVRWGVSIAAEVFLGGSTATNGSREIAIVPSPEPVSGLLPGEPLGLANLIHIVGLPLPQHDTGNTAMTDVMILNEWNAQTLLGTSPPLPPPGPGASLVDQWRGLALRGFVDMIDSVYGIEVGAPRPDRDADLIRMIPSRLLRERLDLVFQGMRGRYSSDDTGTGEDLSKTWTMPVGTVSGQSDLVCFVVPSIGRQTMQHGYLFNPCLNRLRALPGSSILRRFELDPVEPTYVDDPRLIGTFTHALSQRFSLGIERGRDPGPPNTDAATRIRDELSNLQLEDSFFFNLLPAGDDLIWRWHRIREATQIAAPYLKDDGTMSIPIEQHPPDKVVVLVENDPSWNFIFGDIVHLRKRVITSPLNKATRISVPLRVVGVDRGSVTLMVEPDVTFTWTNIAHFSRLHTFFGTGDVLYAVARTGVTPDRAVEYPYKELVARSIRDLINGPGPPFTAPRPLTPFPSVRDDRENQSVVLTDWVGWENYRKKWMPYLIGLYSGGDDMHAGVFHGAPACLLRNEPMNNWMHLCPVCLYILIDQIAPAYHGRFEKWFQKRAPRR